jgi:hypothetical protein
MYSFLNTCDLFGKTTVLQGRRRWCEKNYFLDGFLAVCTSGCLTFVAAEASAGARESKQGEIEVHEEKIDTRKS